MVTIWTRGSNLNIEQIRTARAKNGSNIAVNLIYASHLVICQAQSPAIPLSKELSALVSFEQLSLMEPTSSQFAMQRPHGKLLKFQRLAGRYSGTNGRTLFHSHYTALLGISHMIFTSWECFHCDLYLPRNQEQRTERCGRRYKTLATRLLLWLRFIPTSTSGFTLLPQWFCKPTSLNLNEEGKWRERQFEATKANEFQRESPEKTTDNMLESNRIFKANMKQ